MATDMGLRSLATVKRLDRAPSFWRGTRIHENAMVCEKVLTVLMVDGRGEKAAFIGDGETSRPRAIVLESENRM